MGGYATALSRKPRLGVVGVGEVTLPRCCYGLAMDQTRAGKIGGNVVPENSCKEMRNVAPHTLATSVFSFQTLCTREMLEAAEKYQPTPMYSVGNSSFTIAFVAVYSNNNPMR